MAREHSHDGATARAHGRRYYHDVIVLARNFVAALQSLRVQYRLLEIIRIAGPLTTRELLAFCPRYAPTMNHLRLQRLLTRLRHAGALVGLRVHKSHEVFWALPGQERPRDADRRVQRRVVTIDRRRGQEDRRSPGPVDRGSWWVVGNRAEFQAAVQRRWRDS